MTDTAYDFVNNLAGQLLDHGRPVEFTENSGYINIVSRGRIPREATIEASAVKMISTGEWAFRGVYVYQRCTNPIHCGSRAEAQDAINMYATTEAENG